MPAGTYTIPPPAPCAAAMADLNAAALSPLPSPCAPYAVTAKTCPTVKLDELAPLPPLVDTTIGPLLAPAGTVVVILL